MARDRLGDLAALDAYDVPLEQSTGVGWANRAAEALHARPEYDPTVVARTASPLVTITEGDIGRATEAAMGVSGGGMKTDIVGSRARDPRLWSPISNTKLSKPLDEMAHQYTDIRAPAPKVIDPSELVGSYGIFPPYDLSVANRTLTHVDNVPLPTPVRAHGGFGFSEANPGLAAASEMSIARRLDNQAKKIMEETGKPVNIMPMTMSGSGIDASHHVASPLSQMVQTAKIKKADVKEFDDMMREVVPGWISIKSKKFTDYIDNLQGGMKIKSMMADRMSLAKWQGKGFPDVAAARHAMSDPSLIDLPRNTTGMAISRYVPGRDILETTHPSYSKGVAGQYIGQLASPIPFETAAPAIAEGLALKNAALAAEGKQAIQPAYHMGKPTKGIPTAQYFDQEWLDKVMKQMEGGKRITLRGGAIAAPVGLGALAAQDKYQPGGR